jgi:hypothetical protein
MDRRAEATALRAVSSGRQGGAAGALRVALMMLARRDQLEAGDGSR